MGQQRQAVRRVSCELHRSSGGHWAGPAEGRLRAGRFHPRPCKRLTPRHRGHHRLWQAQQASADQASAMHAAAPPLHAPGHPRPGEEAAPTCREAVTPAQRLRSSALTPERPSSRVEAMSFCMLVGCSTAVCMHSWPCSRVGAGRVSVCNWARAAVAATHGEGALGRKRGQKGSAHGAANKPCPLTARTKDFPPPPAQLLEQRLTRLPSISHPAQDPPRGPAPCTAPPCSPDAAGPPCPGSPRSAREAAASAPAPVRAVARFERARKGASERAAPRPACQQSSYAIKCASALTLPG